MLARILRFSIQQRVFVLAGTALLAVYGLYSAFLLPIDAVPDITNKQVQVSTIAPALGPEEIERQITFPLELALAGLPYLQETRSVSQSGLSQITLVFDDRVDLYFARQLVSQRLQQAQSQLPPGVQAEMGPVTTGLGEIYYVRLESDRLSLREQRTLMEWVVRPQLLSVPGLAEVNVWGGEVRQIQILLDPERLRAFGFSVPDVLHAVASSNQNAGGAYLQRGAEQQVVRTIGALRTLEDVRQIVVGVRAGVPITVGQVARVTEGGMVRQGAITQDGQGEVVYALNFLLIGENGRIVVERVKDRVREIRKSLPAGTALVGFLDRSELIARTLRTAITNLIEGGLLVIGVLFLFLLQWRAGLIVSSVIPLAMLFAIIGMRHFGISANLMSLGAIDFGILVDGAVIIVENCVRCLAEQQRHMGRVLTESERLETIYTATFQVRRASQFGELIILAAYVPVLSLAGVEGKTFRPMALTVILALVGALVLSFTLVPALCAAYLRVRAERENPLVHWLTRLYRPTLEWCFRHRAFLMSASLAFFLFCVWLGSRLGSEFLPQLDEGAIAVEATYAPSISLEQVVERAGAAERLLLQQFPDEIRHVITRIGHSEKATDPMLVNQTDILIELHPRERWRRAHTKAELVAQMAAVLEKMPGVATAFSQPIEMRMGELLQGVGVRSNLGIKLFGPDPEVLARESAKIGRIVARVPGAADVKVETTRGLPQLQIVIRRDQIARYGIRVEDVTAVVEAAAGGKTVTQVVDGAQRVDVAVRFEAAYRDDPEKIGDILIPAPDGVQVPLAMLADIRSVEGPVQISREGGQRRIVVQANVRGRDLGSFTEEVRRRLERAYRLPPGYRLEFGGTYEQLQSGRARLAVATPLTFALVFLLLYATSGSVRQAAMIFTGIPLAVTGGVLALALRGMPFSIPA
ncbi:MAG: CusA/CzcA family heavy metal efflux RND transporter, partial [Chthonomonadaceae bacterium]|nr:CusA/CzcA family heavy metal efflux RND transporter [Chthonomonadaceae bacterium]